MKAMQLSTMMGMSFLLSCCSLRVLPFPPAALWMSVYHREKSVRPIPWRWRVLEGKVGRVSTPAKLAPMTNVTDWVRTYVIHRPQNCACWDEASALAPGVNTSIQVPGKVIHLIVCVAKLRTDLPFSTKTRMSFFSWFSFSEDIPDRQRKIHTKRTSVQWHLCTNVWMFSQRTDRRQISLSQWQITQHHFSNIMTTLVKPHW